MIAASKSCAISCPVSGTSFCRRRGILRASAPIQRRACAKSLASKSRRTAWSKTSASSFALARKRRAEGERGEREFRDLTNQYRYMEEKKETFAFENQLKTPKKVCVDRPSNLSRRSFNQVRLGHHHGFVRRKLYSKFAKICTTQQEKQHYFTAFDKTIDRIFSFEK